MEKILIEGIRIYAYHGCFKEETAIGTNFLIDVELKVDLEIPSLSDNIDDTVNYQSVFQLIKDEMSIPSKLLEHLSVRIIRSLFDEFSAIEEIQLKVSKLNVPLGGHVDRVSLQITKHRKELA